MIIRVAERKDRRKLSSTVIWRLQVWSKRQTSLPQLTKTVITITRQASKATNLRSLRPKSLSSRDRHPMWSRRPRYSSLCHIHSKKNCSHLRWCGNNFQHIKLTTTQQGNSHLTTKVEVAIQIKEEENSNSTSSRTCLKLVSSSCRIKHMWTIVMVKAWCSHSSKLTNREPNKKCECNRTLWSRFKCSRLPRLTMCCIRTRSREAHCRAQMAHLVITINWHQTCYRQSAVTSPTTTWLKISPKTTIQWLSSIRKTTWSAKVHLAKCTQP